jgi:hypothetical protein
MVTNSAVLAVLILMLAVFWVGGETTFLASYKRLLFTEYGLDIGLFLLVLFVNLFAACYALSRVLFLKDTGMKLRHVDRQLVTTDAVLADLTRHLKE